MVLPLFLFTLEEKHYGFYFCHRFGFIFYSICLLWSELLMKWEVFQRSSKTGSITKNPKLYLSHFKSCWFSSSSSFLLSFSLSFFLSFFNIRQRKKYCCWETTKIWTTKTTKNAGFSSVFPLHQSTLSTYLFSSLALGTYLSSSKILGTYLSSSMTSGTYLVVSCYIKHTAVYLWSDSRLSLIW